MYKYMTYEDRHKLEELYLKNVYLPDIAEEIGVSLATIYRELKKGFTGKLDKNGRYEYSAELAQEVLAENFRCKGRKKNVRNKQFGS